MNETLTLEQLTEYLGIKRRTLYNMIEDGRFPVKPIKGTRPRRWATRKVDRWVAAGSKANG